MKYQSLFMRKIRKISSICCLQNLPIGWWTQSEPVLFVFSCPYLLSYTIALPIYAGVLSLFVIANFGLATFMDPGIYPRGKSSACIALDITHFRWNKLSLHYIVEQSEFKFKYVRLWYLDISREKWLNYLQTVDTRSDAAFSCIWCGLHSYRFE